MNAVDFPRLFHAILSPRAKVDAAAIERMGLLAVKIAQMYAVRSDLLGEEKCLELSRLLQRAGPLTADEFKHRWDELAPAALTDALEDLAQVPLAAASLGQVHRATLRDGREIVVKIAKRDVRESFHSEFARLYQDFAGKTAVEASLTRQMMLTVKIAVRNGVIFPSGAFPLIKSLMYLDGMVLRAAPQARLLRDVARFEDDFPETDS